MGNFITYEMIIPIQWAEIDINILWGLITPQLGALIAGGENVDNSIIIVNDFAVLLTIRHEDLSWWFRIPGDHEPNPRRYRFSGDLLVTMYPTLFNPYIRELNIQGLPQPMYPSMGRELHYSTVVPQEWLVNRTSENLCNIIFLEIDRRMMLDDDYLIDESQIIIDGIRTRLSISNNRLAWCFIKQCDVFINEIDYVVINNYVSGLFRRMTSYYNQFHDAINEVAQVNMVFQENLDDDDEGVEMDYESDSS